MEAVSDAGPLIHLYEIGGLALLRIFDRRHIPEVVWMETVGQGRVPEGAVTALRSVERHEVARREVNAFAEQYGLGHLHKGERACLYLCRRRQPISIVLTDDLAVREAAQKLDLTPVGSLGVVVRAYRHGHITLEAAERCLLNLQDESTLFVTRAIVEMALEQLRLHAGGGG